MARDGPRHVRPLRPLPGRQNHTADTADAALTLHSHHITLEAQLAALRGYFESMQRKVPASMPPKKFRDKQ